MFVEDLAVLSWQMAVVRVADSKRRYLTREFLHPIKVAVLKAVSQYSLVT
jgi:hypothetical protein